VEANAGGGRILPLGAGLRWQRGSLRRYDWRRDAIEPFGVISVEIYWEACSVVAATDLPLQVLQAGDVSDFQLRRSLICDNEILRANHENSEKIDRHLD
jgi:hypothetical protein